MKQNNSLSAFFGLNKYRRAGAISSLLILLVLAIAITLNALTSLLPPSAAKINLSQKHTFDVSSESIEWVENNLQSDVTVYWLCDGGIASADSELYQFLLRYADLSDRIRLKVIDPSSVGNAFIERFGGTWPADRSLIVESNLRYRIVDINELYYYYFNDGANAVSLTAAEYEEVLASVMAPDSGYSDDDLEVFLSMVTPYFDGNARLTNAINFVTRDRLMKIYALTGSGTSALDSDFVDLLDQACHEVGTTLTVADLPKDCDVLVIHAPTADLSAAEAAALSDYLAGGGKLFLTTFYAKTDLPNLAAVLDDYGLGFGTPSGSIVLENDVNYSLRDTQKVYPMFFMAHLQTAHPFSEGFGNEFLVYYPHAITLTEVEGVTLTPWLSTSKKMGQLTWYDETEKKQVYGDEKAEYTVGAIAEKGDTQIVWIASPDALTTQINVYSANSANFNLARSMLERLGGTEDAALSIAPVVLPVPTLTVTANQFMIWSIVLVLVLPIAVFAIGLIVWFRRRHR